MKTTLELPDELMRRLKIRAAESDRKLKDVVTDMIERGMEASNSAERDDPLQRWVRKLEFHDDGTVTNPDGIDDPQFFETLEQIREEDRRRGLRDPFADRE